MKGRIVTQKDTAIHLLDRSCFFIYVKPTAKEVDTFNKGVALLSTSAAPLLNPFIYTLRNQQVKQAFKDTVRKLVPRLSLKTNPENRNHSSHQTQEETPVPFDLLTRVKCNNTTDLSFNDSVILEDRSTTDFSV
ncbi:hypothetical protein MJG53_004360 [Ovis ammon polii x Ovis aries]|uniref:Uncharacterized protein n=1 Tax=Ovis ammon polii x Ovis aries TaxID=2918886 RepID=A0ACB9VA21_9CETA|nr:hypothetical protein MJG53_004360 [Ovis ammon polii x Ovis aries]